MDLLRTPITVSVGPDWWMIGVTLASAIATAVLAVLAYLNGRKATSIAEEATRIAAESADIARDAAERDAAHKEMETLRKDASVQNEVALAMVRAFNAQDYSAATARNNDSGRGEAVSLSNAKVLEALAQIDIYAWTDDEENLRTWFSNSLNRLRELANDRNADDEYATHLRTTLWKISLWNRNVIPTSRLSEDVQLPSRRQSR